MYNTFAHFLFILGSSVWKLSFSKIGISVAVETISVKAIDMLCSNNSEFQQRQPVHVRNDSWDLLQIRGFMTKNFHSGKQGDEKQSGQGSGLGLWGGRRMWTWTELKRCKVNGGMGMSEVTRDRKEWARDMEWA